MTQLSIKVFVAQWLERLPGNQKVIYFSVGMNTVSLCSAFIFNPNLLFVLTNLFITKMVFTHSVNACHKRLSGGDLDFM